MAVQSACAICGTRRARRFCPGIDGHICPICCGTQREVTVNCPLDCQYLREARLRDKPPVVDPATLPNADVRIPEEFVRQNEVLVISTLAVLSRTALETSGAVDSDVRLAVESLIKTQRTLQSGLYYDSRPDDRVAQRIYGTLQEHLVEIKKKAAENGVTIKDSDVTGTLVFMQRLAIQHDNGRPKGRAFIDLLRESFPPAAAEKQEGSLILP